MKKLLAILLMLTVLFSFVGCKTNDTSEKLSDVEIARQNVIDKWKNEAGILGTAGYIENIYKEYPNDEVISNIYFYVSALDALNLYEILDNDVSYLELAKEYALKIDPNYDGEFSEEIHKFVNSLVDSKTVSKEHEKARMQEDKYMNLTNSEKKEICNYIQERYDYYDKLNGGYSGDKYSDTIMQEAAKKYGLTTMQIKLIWMNSYSY